jgi:hypothetical protein
MKNPAGEGGAERLCKGSCPATGYSAPGSGILARVAGRGYPNPRGLGYN